MVVTYIPVVDAYVERLIRAPEYKDIGGLSFIDTKAVQDAICGFFLTAAPKTSPAPPTS